MLDLANMNLLSNETDPTEEVDPAEGILAAKLTAMVVLSVATFILGFIPIVMSRVFKWNQDSDYEMERSNNSRLVLSLLLSFGGGALLCTTFLHLLPEVDETLTALQHDGVIPETSFALTHLIMCCGFFMMYFIEELVHLYLHSRSKAKKHEEEIERVLHRSISVRRCSTDSVISKTDTTGSNSTVDTKDDNCDDNCHHDVQEKSHEGHSHNGDSHEGHSHHGHSHEGHSHHGHSHEGHSHQDHSHHGHSHQANGGVGDGNSCNQKGHSHVIIPVNEDNQVVTSFRGLLIVVALSVHELFEGLAVGLETTTSGTYYMMGAVASHKLVLAFCVGLELVSAKTPMRLNFIYMGAFALVSPVGIAIGIGLSAANSSGDGVVNVVLQGIACGTLLYVVFFEVLTRERVNSKMNGLLQLLAIMVGFSTMFGLQLATSHEHDHEDEHDDHVTTVATALLMSALPSRLQADFHF